MPNPVYDLLVAELAKITSERVAETMVAASVQEMGFSPDAIESKEMHRVINGPLMTRLGTVMPVRQAQSELRAIARVIERHYPKGPTVMNLPAVDLHAPLPNPVLAQTPEHEAAPELVTQPAAAAPASNQRPMPSLSQLGQPQAESTGPSVISSQLDSPESDFDIDDFELDDPGISGPDVRAYDLSDPATQENLMQEISRIQGVQGVLICDESGEVLRERGVQNGPNVGAVMAATTMMLQQYTLRLMSVDLGNRIVCMRPVGNHAVIVVAGAKVNIGRLFTQLQQVQGQV